MRLFLYHDHLIETLDSIILLQTDDEIEYWISWIKYKIKRWVPYRELDAHELPWNIFFFFFTWCWYCGLNKLWINKSSLNKQVMFPRQWIWCDCYFTWRTPENFNKFINDQKNWSCLFNFNQYLTSSITSLMGKRLNYWLNRLLDILFDEKLTKNYWVALFIDETQKMSVFVTYVFDSLNFYRWI